ncbi:MAG: hypothetical protein LLG00_16220 [Planctomycetaceae bacterium]|nr:hypothetical protein [Planctomycetaceae bacterium]
MATKLNAHGRSTRLPRIGRHSTGHRRLAVERIEDRLLLSAVFQTLIDTQPHQTALTVDPSLIIVSPTIPNGWTGPSTAICDGYTKNWQGPVPAFYDNTAHLSPASIAPTLCPIGDLQLPGNNLADTIEIPAATKPPVVAMVASPAAQPVATRNDAARAGVDATSGRCQAFELATAHDENAGFHAERAKEALGVAAWKKIPLASSDVASPVNAASPQYQPSAYQISTRRTTPDSIAISLASAIENPRVEHPAARLGPPNPSAPSASPRKVIVTASLPTMAVGSQPAQASDGAELARQAVFAEIANDADSGTPLPAYPLDTRQTAIAIALVSLAGPRLSERWRSKTELCPTCLVPPRQRETA